MLDARGGVHDGIGPGGGDKVDRRRVGDIGANHLNAGGEVGGITAGKVVQHDGARARAHKLIDKMAADEARPAGDQHGAGFLSWSL